METLRTLYVGAVALVGASAPLAALTGYYAPYCAQAVVWTFSGYHVQYVCY
jgi:hypothetical protein